MSATLNNAGLELIKEEAAEVPARAIRTQPPTEALGHEALQALLAFSALHEQIRTRRAKQMRNGGRPSPEDDWQLEQFVLDEVLQLVAERALAITGADGVAIALAEGNAIVCRASAGSIAPDAGIRLDPNSGFSGECLVSGRIVRSDDAESDPRVNVAACRRLGVRSMLAVPLSAKQSVIGLIEAFSNEPYGFNDSDVRSLGLLAELILSAMKPEEEDRLREISRRVVNAPVQPEPIPVIVPDVATEKATAPTSEQNGSSAQGESSSAASELATIPESKADLGRSAESSSPKKGWEKNQVEKSELLAIGASKSTDLPVIPAEHAPAERAELDRSRPGLAVVAVVVLFAIALGAGVWWALGHHAHSAKADARPVTLAASPHTLQPVTAPAEPLAN